MGDYVLFTHKHNATAKSLHAFTVLWWGEAEVNECEIHHLKYI